VVRRGLVPDEFCFQTLLANEGWRIGESNHLISRFEDAHPVMLGLPDLPVLARSPRFFARKFPDEPSAPVRRAVLAGLNGTSGRIRRDDERMAWHDPGGGAGSTM